MNWVMPYLVGIVFGIMIGIYIVKINVCDDTDWKSPTCEKIKEERLKP